MGCTNHLMRDMSTPRGCLVFSEKAPTWLITNITQEADVSGARMITRQRVAMLCVSSACFVFPLHSPLHAGAI